jgi:hypothetical protein
MPSVAQDFAGIVDIGNGDINIGETSRWRAYLGDAVQPCPLCNGGFCSGGLRDGLACSVDGIHPTWGPASLDCPPYPGANISGIGLGVFVHETTGNVSLSTGCGTCSGDTTLGCGNNADCLAASAGSCSASGGVASSCFSPPCSPTAPGSTEGLCVNDPADEYCDGFVAANGDGFIACTSDGDCTTFDAGTCTFQRKRPCFMSPIVATGVSGVDHAESVAIFCVPPSGSSFVDTTVGLPGPARQRLDLSRTDYCADGITAYTTGGLSCP